MSFVTFVLFVIVIFELVYNLIFLFLSLYDKILEEYYKIDNKK